MWSFIKVNLDGGTGGQIFAFTSSIESKLSDFTTWILVDSSTKLPIPSFINRVFKELDTEEPKSIILKIASFINFNFNNFCITSELKLKNSVKKYLLKMALESILPNDVLYDPKNDLSLAYQNWLQGPLNSFMDEIFNEVQIIKSNISSNNTLMNTDLGKGIRIF